MVIGIEAQRIFRKKKHGMDMVALELIRQLQKIDQQNKYYIYVAPGSDTACLEETSNFKIRTLKMSSYPLWEQIALPKAAQVDQCDLLHCTSNTAPLSCPVPLVVTIHDVIYLEKSISQLMGSSGTSYQKMGNLYRRFVVPQIVQKCKAVITVSQFEKRQIASLFGLNEEKLFAVYNGVSSYFKPITDAETLSNYKEKYHLPEQFFFHLGNTDPKKNTLGVIKAYGHFLRETQQQIPLVMLDFDHKELKKLVKESGFSEVFDHIHLTGYVPNHELPAIYSLCSIFLYPSLRESFGIPILEAMACGAPVITSNTSSMPEIADDAALLVDPYHPEQITQAMIQLFNDQNLRNRLIEKGFQQASRFTWEEMAKKVLTIYEKVLAS